MSKVILRTGFLLILWIPFQGISQDPLLDSLLQVAETSPDDTGKANTLNLISRKYFSSNPDTSIVFANKALELSTKLGFTGGQALSFKNLGIAHFNKGEYIDALKFYESSLAAYQSAGNKTGVANIYSNMGNIYYNQGDDEKALDLYLNSLNQSEEINDTLRIVTALINIGAIYGKKRQTYDKAIEYYRTAYPLTLKLNDHSTIGITAVNLGEVYMLQNRFDSALHYFNVSLEAVEGTQDAPYTMNAMGSLYRMQNRYEDAITIHRKAYQLSHQMASMNDMAISLVGLAQSHEGKGEWNQALQVFKEAEQLALELNSTYSLRDVYTGLSEVYTRLNDFPNATRYQSLLLAVKDSIYNLETDKKLGTLQFTFDLQKKESQIDLLTKEQELKEEEIRRQKVVRNGFMSGFAIVLIFAGIFLFQRNRISIARKRSDELLLNILPEETAEELKTTGKAKAKFFDSVSVLFTDFKNFTLASEKLSAEELVKEIDYCFGEFDRIVTKYGLEKIKTIGDSYMCAGGLPVRNSRHAEDVIRAGLEMQQFVADHKKERQAEGLIFFELRLGIHSGPVVAGVVGRKKFAYDIWGDAVNTASRMESSGEVGRVNISQDTYELVKDKFTFTYRGKISAKNKGEIDMYFVDGILTGTLPAHAS